MAEHALSFSTDILLKHGVKPWAALPLWSPRTNFIIDTFKARQALHFASTNPAKALADSADAFLAEGRVPVAGLSSEAEANLLVKLR